MSGLYNFSEEDVAMLKEALGYSRCLIWDNKLNTDNEYKDYCDGDCHVCAEPLTISKFLESKQVK